MFFAAPATGGTRLAKCVRRAQRCAPALGAVLLWAAAGGDAVALDVSAVRAAGLDTADRTGRYRSGVEKAAGLPAADVPPAPRRAGRSPAVDSELPRGVVLELGQRGIGVVRNGIGLDFTMGAIGGLHFNLYSRRNPKGPGKRWNLNQEGPDAAASPQRFWSLGATLDRDGGGQVVVVPQLLLHFDVPMVARSRAQASLQYADWRSPRGKGHGAKIPQVVVSFRLGD